MFIIAIHVGPDEAGLVTDIEVARIEGADGIILIKDYTTSATNVEVLRAYDYARTQYPRWWIGVNLLGYAPNAAILSTSKSTSGIWVDDTHVDEDRENGVEFLSDIRRALDLYRPEALFLPSIAFKYQKPVKDVAKVAKLAAPYADILVTSGDATGAAADFKKIETMRAATDVPLGLASGVSTDNVRRFVEIGVNAFIVNTSISDPTTTRLDQEKVGLLRERIPR